MILNQSIYDSILPSQSSKTTLIEDLKQVCSLFLGEVSTPKTRRTLEHACQTVLVKNELIGWKPVILTFMGDPSHIFLFLEDSAGFLWEPGQVQDVFCVV